MDFKLKKSNLNFSVKTAEAVPTAPGKENDIVVITSVPMKNWVLTPDAPGGAPRNDGDVWICYSTSGSVCNVVKSGSVMIAPTSAFQYVGGVWENVSAVIYQGGKWVAAWDGKLYLNGNEYETVTGGWQTQRPTGYFNADGKATKNATSIALAASSNQYITATPSKKIDLTSFDWLYFKVDSVTVGGSAYAHVAVYLNDEFSNATAVKILTTPTVGVNALNISDLSGAYFVGFGCGSTGTASAITVSEVYLA